MDGSWFLVPHDWGPYLRRIPGTGGLGLGWGLMVAAGSSMGIFACFRRKG